MARGRFISNSLGSSRRFTALGRHFGGLGEFAQALYQLLIAHADDYGRQEGDAFTVKSRVFPTSPRSEIEFDGALDAMEHVNLVLRYQAAGRQVLQIVDFDKHQTLRKRDESKFPAPLGRSPVSSTEDAVARREEKRTEVEEKRSKSVSAEPPNGSTPESEPVLVFPTVGTAGRTWQLSEAQLAEWATSFPVLDVEAEARKALAWIRANPNRCKTSAGMPRFLVNWFSRAVDRGGGKANGNGRHLPEASPPSGVDWYAECGEIHSHECGLDRWAHHERKQRESFQGKAV